MSKYFLLFILIFLQFHVFSQNFVNRGAPTNSVDNSTVTTDKESNEYLIVFKSPGLIQELQENMYLKAASHTQPIKSEHDRFVSDLSLLRKTNSTGLKSASTPIFKYELFRTLNAVIIESNDEEIAKIKTLDYVKIILKNERIQLIKEQISDNNLKSASDITTGTYTENGKGVKVGIIDSGIDYKNPALGGGFGTGFKVAGGYDFENNDNDPMDDDGHGTSVAGVIAADGELIGIAPKATLYAYKVMNAWGWGWSNNAFKALEYCVDPNQDFDLSDHLDIINMSIAAYYMSETEFKTFSDIFKLMANLKMVVCVAAGNEGPNYLLFNSLAVSEDVLSVGSCNSNNNISTFSSRGYGINNYSIKPDLVALGENVKLLSLINSTVENGGTSIASPGVAGVATLLKQKHKDWNYNQIKSALINSADDLGFNVMEQGAGKVNLNATLNQTTIAFPQTINWGIASDNNGIITKTCIITLFNKSNEQQKYNFDFGKNILQGIDFKADVSSLDLNPNDSISVALNLTLDQSQLKYPDQIPYNYFGRIKVNGTKDSLSIPWTLLRGCDIKLMSDIKFTNYDSQILKILKNGQQINPNAIYDPSNDIIVPPGRYDFLFKANEGRSGYHLTDTLKSYLYIRENIDISGSLNLDLSKAVIKNRIDIQSVDAFGNALSGIKLISNEAVYKPYPTSYDFLGIKSKFSALEPILYSCSYDKYYINDFETSDNYKLIVGDYKARIGEKSDFFVVNYEVDQDIKGNLMLNNQPGSLYPFTFIFYPFPNQKSNYSLSGGTVWSGNGNSEIPLNKTTQSTLWINKKKEGVFDLTAFPVLSTKDSIGRFGGVSMFGAIYSYGDSIQIRSLRSPYREVFQTVLKKDTVFVNNGPVFYSLNIADRYNYKYFGCYSYLKGMYGENLEYGFSNSSITIFDSNNKIVYHNKVGKYNDDPYTGSLDRAKIEMSTSDYFINGQQGKALLKYNLKGNPPSQFTSIQSLQFLNNLNQIRSVYKIGSSARMNLVVNYASQTSSIKIFYKFSDETEWKERSISLTKNQFDENIIETDISDLMTKSIGLDFKIDAVDVYGNKMSYTLEPAIGIGDYHENHDFNILEIPNTIALKNTVVKKKVVFDAFIPEFRFFNWESSVIEGAGTVRFSNDSVCITPSTNFTGQLTAQIKGADGQEKDSILVTVYFNELNNASFNVNPEYQNEDMVGQIGTKYLQDNIHYHLLGDISSTFALDSLTGKLFVRDKDNLFYQEHRQFNLKVIGSNEINKDTANITIFVKTKPVASDLTFDVAKGKPAGTIVGLLKASDEDGDTLSYSVLSGNTNEIFGVDKSTGALIINKEKEFVGGEIFTLKWQASDGEFTAEAIATINILVPTSAKIENLSISNIYPNPTKGIIYVKNIHSGTTIEVYNLSGENLISSYLISDLGWTNLDLSYLQSGIYILKTTSNSIANSYKIIKL
jgi:subtilisin family serine protease